MISTVGNYLDPSAVWAGKADLFFAFQSLSALRHAMVWLCSTVHESFSWNYFLRTRHSPVNVPTAAVPPFSPRDN